MSRKIRLKCPQCQTLIETSVEDELRVTLECAACHKQFTAKVPPKAQDGPQATQKSQPVVAAQPVAARPVAAKPVAAKPVAAQPVAAQPVAARPVAAQPVQPGFDQGHATGGAPGGDPLFGGANDFSFPIAPAAYQPVRRRKPLNLRPIFNIVGGVTAAVLVLGAALFAWNWAVNTDWSTFSLTRDTGEGLVDEFCARVERTADIETEITSGKEIDYEHLKDMAIEQGRWAESFVVRAVRIQNVPRDKKSELQAKYMAAQTKVRDALAAKQAQLMNSGQKAAGLDQKRLAQMMKEEPKLKDFAAAMVGVSNYVEAGIYELRAPDNETQRIYFEEAALVKEYLQELSYVRSASQSKRRAEKIEKLADKMMDLASRRAAIPPNFFEQVPREYDDKDRAHGVAQLILVARIKRDAQPDKTLKAAVANFNEARTWLSSAARGPSHVDFKSRFAESRKARAESDRLMPGDLFFEMPSAEEELEMVFKAPREPQTEPTREPTPQPTAPAQPANNSIASNNSPSPNMSSTSSSQDASSPPSGSSTDSKPLAASVPLPPSPGMPNSFPGGMPRGMGGAMGGGFRANVGPPIDGSGFVMPQNAGPPPLSKNESVKIIITKSSLDGNELVKRLATSLNSDDYRMSASNGKITIQIKYTGDMDRVVQLVDFGKVTLIDSPERTIHVAGE